MADHLPVPLGHNDPAEVQVRVQRGGGVLGQLEQRPELVPGAGVDLEPDVVVGQRRLVGHGVRTGTARSAAS
jgi:hypothetical protein